MGILVAKQKNNFALCPRRRIQLMNKKLRQAQLSQKLIDISIGMILGDASIQKTGKEAFIKFEQGYKQKEFVDHLFLFYKDFCFTNQVKIRTRPEDRDKIKSYYFRTYALSQFTSLYDLFFPVPLPGSKKRKAISTDIITKKLTPEGLAYWIMCDGNKRICKL